MSEIAKKLRERRNNVWQQAKELADRAAEENRAFEAEEQGQWDSLNEELDKLDTRIKSALDTEKRSKEVDDTIEELSGGKQSRSGETPSAPQDQELEQQFRALAMGERRSVTVGLPSAFQRNAMLNSTEQRATPLSTGNSPTPTSFISQLYNYLVDTSSIRRANPKVYTTSSGENLMVPRSTAESQATWTGEAAALTESEPTLSSVTLGAYKLGAIMYASSELLADTGFDLLGFIAEQAGRAIGIAADTAYVTGDGTSKPSGFVGSATVGIQQPSGNMTQVNADSLFDLFHSVIPQYRPRGSWIFNDASIKELRKITDSTGQYLWQPGLQAGEPDRLLGRPVYADPNMPTLGADAKFGAFGDFGGYWIRDVTPIRFDRSDDFKFGEDVTSFRVLYRTDGQLGDTNAVKLIQASSA